MSTVCVGIFYDCVIGVCVSVCFFFVFFCGGGGGVVVCDCCNPRIKVKICCWVTIQLLIESFIENFKLLELVMTLTDQVTDLLFNHIITLFVFQNKK